MADKALGSGPNGERWLGAVEGYYGPPLRHRERIDLIEWLSGHGFNSYAYGPKDDPYHRQRWREPYPNDRLDELGDLVNAGDQFGVVVSLGISPGLDWREGDEADLITKLTQFRHIGAKALAVAWDDVPPGGGELGKVHGTAVARAVKEVGEDLLWVAVPTDYSGLPATEYLKEFVRPLPDNVEVAWTGPGIVSPRVTGAEAASLAVELGRKLLFAENFPVNDGAMGGVLHLGPYPERSPDLVDETTGIFCNFMSLSLASRVGLAVAARFWSDPTVDRERSWLEVLDEFPGLQPLARSSRSWVSTPAPDPELMAWADAAKNGDVRLRNYLQAGCRSGMDPALAKEVEPWLDQWERESNAMQAALELIAHPTPPAELGFLVATLWDMARHSRQQLFGIRWAYYPVTERSGQNLVTSPDALVLGENLTDRLCLMALTRSAGEVPAQIER